jgi:hypothetical protein
MKSTMFSKMLIATILTFTLGGAAYVATWHHVPHVLANDSPTGGVPQFKGTHGLELNDDEIIAANRVSGTMTFHKNSQASLLDRIITVSRATAEPAP